MELLRSILAVLALYLVNPVVPASPSPVWDGSGSWAHVGEHWQLDMASATLPALCRLDLRQWLRVPTIVQGRHRFYLDGRLLMSTSQDAAAGSMNSAMAMPCAQIAHGQRLQWTVTTTTGSYASLKFWPYLVPSRPIDEVFTDTLPVASAGILLILAVVFYVLFQNAEGGRKTMIPLSLGCFFTAVHFMLTTPANWNIVLPPFYLHRGHDISLWLGTGLIWLGMESLGIVGRRVRRTQSLTTILALLVIVIAADLDQAQVGSTLAFLVNIGACSLVLVSQIARLFINWNRQKKKFLVTDVLRALSIATWATAGIVDLLTHANIWHLPPVYPLGMIGCVVGIAFYINTEIQATYRERRDLQDNLEMKVAEKTEELRMRAASLKTAYDELAAAKADAINSAKLASLGTLAAGIAHEINNALNYVRGSLDPLRGVLARNPLPGDDQRKTERLLTLMQEGLDLTMDIIKNLKMYSAPGGHELEDVLLSESAATVLSLLRAKLVNHVIVVNAIPPELRVRATRVGVMQVLLNLIANAVDALAESSSKDPEIRLSAAVDGEICTVVVADNGPGIPEAIRSRVFEPFFTTKEVGKGTGLGLHIIKKEMQRFGGTVELASGHESGATFLLKFKAVLAEKSLDLLAIESPRSAA